MSATHGNKEVKRLFREIERLGFTIVHIKNTYRIYPPNKDARVYTTHGTPKAIKAIYSDFRKLYGVELDPVWKDRK